MKLVRETELSVAQLEAAGMIEPKGPTKKSYFLNAVKT